MLKIQWQTNHIAKRILHSESGKREAGSKKVNARSQREEFRPWQRSWGRRLWHMQRRDRASGNPLFPSIYPQNRNLPTLLTLSPTPLTLWGAVPHRFSRRRSKCAAPVKIPGRDKSVSTYLWRFSLACLSGFVRPHVIVYSLPAMRGTRCFKTF